MQAVQKNSNQPEMAEYEGIQAIVNQVAIQAVTAIHGRPALKQLSFIWNVTDR